MSRRTRAATGRDLAAAPGADPFAAPGAATLAAPGADPLAADPSTPARVAAVNPVAKLGAAMLIAVGLVLSIDWVSATVAIVLELAMLPWLGLAPRVLLRRSAPIVVAAVLGGITVLLYGAPSGVTHLRFLLVHVSDGSITLSIATVLRVLAIALPSVLLFATIDTTAFADALAQVLRLPARFVLGALGAVRLVGLLVEDWRALALARRARGLGDDGRLRRLAAQAFGLLVLAIRRGTLLATAMEARGLGAAGERTWARPSRLAARDALVLLVGAAIAGIAVTAAVATGHWNFIGGVRGG